MTVKKLKARAAPALTKTEMLGLIDELNEFPSKSLAGVS